jgi:hypothetical protein
VPGRGGHPCARVPLHCRGPLHSDRGSVVVEAALVIPVLLLVTVLLVWVTSLGATYVRALDVAQTAARQLARGVAWDSAPPGIEVTVSDADGLIRVEASQMVSPPLLSFAGWGVTITADAHAVPEWAGDGGVAP